MFNDTGIYSISCLYGGQTKKALKFMLKECNGHMIRELCKSSIRAKHCWE